MQARIVWVQIATILPLLAQKQKMDTNSLHGAYDKRILQQAVLGFAPIIGAPICRHCSVRQPDAARLPRHVTSTAASDISHARSVAASRLAPALGACSKASHHVPCFAKAGRQARNMEPKRACPASIGNTADAAFCKARLRARQQMTMPLVAPLAKTGKYWMRCTASRSWPFVALAHTCKDFEQALAGLCRCAFGTDQSRPDANTWSCCSTCSRHPLACIT